MNKQLMISLPPEQAVNVLNGKATLILKKFIPKDYVGWVYVYVSKGGSGLYESRVGGELQGHYHLFGKGNVSNGIVKNGKVAFRFWFDEYDKLLYVKDRFYERSYELSYKQQRNLCLTDEQIHIYGKGKDLYAWHIKKLEVFDEPKELSEFVTEYDMFDTDANGVQIGWHPVVIKRLMKSPQRMTWVYVNE